MSHVWPVDVRAIMILSAAGYQLGCETIQIQRVLFRKPIHLLIVDTLVILPRDTRGHSLRECCVTALPENFLHSVGSSSYLLFPL